MKPIRPPPPLSLRSRWCFFAAAAKETDVISKETDDQLREALLKQFELTKEKDALIKEKDALIKEKEVQLAAFTKEKDALIMEKDALAKGLAAAISTCAVLKSSADRLIAMRATVAYPPNQAAAAGA